MPKANVPEIVAAPLTGGGYAYLTATWPALLEGGLGDVRIKTAAQTLFNALHAVASGGTLNSVSVSGGNPGPLNELLNEAIRQTNIINKLLGDIRVRS